MGQDKAWLTVGGRPLIEHVARRCLPLTAEFIISASDPTPFQILAERLPVPVTIVRDIFPHSGPLGGLHAGLSAAQRPLCFALATDMPFVNLDLVRLMYTLAEDADAVVPRLPPAPDADPLAEPLLALYRQSCLPAITQRLQSGERRLISFLPDVRTRYVHPSEIQTIDPLFLSFANINTPEEWAAARRRLPDT
jgi:molybdopterin-guanine dinucleotide biosynthesis protein A